MQNQRGLSSTTAFFIISLEIIFIIGAVFLLFLRNTPEKYGMFISNDGDDDNPGTLEKPWKTVERAFDKSKSEHMTGGKTLYLREGIYRINQSVFESNLRNNSLSGTAEKSTIIRGYHNEKAKIYLSQNIVGWQSYNSKDSIKKIYYIDWIQYLKNNHPAFIDDINYYWNNIPQAVYVDQENPVILQQVNADITRAHINLIQGVGVGPISLRTNQNDMIAGDFYYEKDYASPNYGKLFIWLSDGSDPNTKNIEAPLAFRFVFEGNWIKLSNLIIRYGGDAGGFGINGNNNIIENVDSSYNSYVGIDGRCFDCIIRNSKFNFNGATGSFFRGEGTIYENNVFDNNNIRRFNQGGLCGGVKLYESGANDERSQRGIANMTFRENTFSNTVMCSGLWLDWMKDGNIIENNIFIKNLVGISMEVTKGTAENPNIIRNNIFMDIDDPVLNPSGFYPGIIISSSHYVYIYNNLFYHSGGGVAMYTVHTNIPEEDLYRDKLTNNKVYNNIFLKVTLPLVIERASDKIINNYADYNLFYEPYGQGTSTSKSFGGVSNGNTKLFCLHTNLRSVNCYSLSAWQELFNKYDIHSLENDPKVVNADNHNFMLQSNSPAINKGLSVPEVIKDIRGFVRTGSIDIGPYEYP